MAETDAPTTRAKRGTEKKRKPEGLRDRYSVAFIGVNLGVAERTAHNILTRAGLKDGGTGCEFLAAANAIVAHYVTELEGVDVSMQSDKAAKMKAERISAEVDAAKKQGELLMKSDVEAIWADAWARMRVFIESFPSLDRESRRELVTGLIDIGMHAPGLRAVTDDAS